MREGKPSRTALQVALHRAAHQLLDNPQVFTDPMALRILDAESVRALRADPGHFERALTGSYLRAILAARSRIAEDALAESVVRGVTQYVILGAGLDTFAYRNPFPSLRVFEVDHPATQAWKRELLQENTIGAPGNLAFVSVDFNRESFADELVNAGFDPGHGAMFSWLGVTPYVTRAIIAATLTSVASLVGRTGGIVLDYVVPPETLPLHLQALMALRRAQLKAIGEPWVSFLSGGEMAGLLRAAGFQQISDLGPDEINQRYFSDRNDGLMVGSVGRVVNASLTKNTAPAHHGR
ncbi:MAG: SAM-dependent methyltransferase [Gemmatimonadota bacterium]